MSTVVDVFQRRSGVWVPLLAERGGVLLPPDAGGDPPDRVVNVGVDMPYSATTGVPVGQKLKSYGPGDSFTDVNGKPLTISATGRLVITAPGIELYGYDLQCAIDIRTGTGLAPKIRRSKVHAPAVWTDSLTALSQVVYCAGSLQKGTLLEDVEIWAEKPSDWTDGLKGAEFTSRRLNIHDVTDTMLVSGDNVLDEASWLHGNLHWEVDRTKSGGPSHDDGLQIEGGRNLRWRGTRIDGAFNSAIQVTQNFAPIDGLEFDRMWCDRGQYTINVSEKRSVRTTNVEIKNFRMTGVRFGGHSALNVDAGIPSTTRAVMVATDNVNLLTGGPAIIKNA